MGAKMNWRESLEALRRFDASALSLKDIGSWPLRVTCTATVLVFGFAAGAGYPWLVAPERERQELAQLKEDELRRAYRRKSAQAEGFAVDRASREILETEAAAMFRLLPGGREIPDLLDDITAAAEDNGLIVRSLDLQPERPDGFYAEWPMEIAVEGGYHEVGSFVSRVASLPRIVTLHDFDIESVVADGVLERVRMRLLARTYRRLDQEGDGT